MAEQSGFFDAHLIGGEYDRVYLASSFARYFASFIGNGVFADKAAGLMVYQTNPSTMGVKVLPGQAWINGYWYENDSEFSLPIDIADGVLNRIDLVVLRWGTVERSINLVVKKGTPASNAVAPVVQRDSDYYELKLAEIHVTAGSTSITQANIVDTRADTNTCGWVTGVIKQVDTAELFAQWQAAYEAAYAETQTYHAEQKAAWERFFANTTEDSVFPVPALEDVGKVPVVNATADGYELKEFLSLLGGTMKGDVAMGGHKVTGLGNPEEDGDAVPKKYIDALSASDVGAVPTSRTVNGKALSSNITLSASDVGARPSTWTPSASDVGAVPTSRTVNGKALSSNITLSASDVGARPSTWTPSASDVGAASATPSVSSASSAYHTVYLAKIGKLVICTLVLKALSATIYSETITIPSGYRPSAAKTFTIYSDIGHWEANGSNVSNGGKVTVNVATGGALTISNSYSFTTKEVLTTLCWATS